jgi:hypothetical protein
MPIDIQYGAESRATDFVVPPTSKIEPDVPESRPEPNTIAQDRDIEDMRRLVREYDPKPH